MPTAPGGGSVSFVDPLWHRYLDAPVAREEGGTPAIVESIRAGPVDPPLRLTDVRFDSDGRMNTPAVHHHRLGEEALSGQLELARKVLGSRLDRIGDGPTGLPADFERLRWFPLPPLCVEQTRPGLS
ncbi:hypothetical protein [Streptomyces chartreusis]